VEAKIPPFFPRYEGYETIDLAERSGNCTTFSPISPYQVGSHTLLIVIANTGGAMSISGSCALMDDCSSCTLMEGAECAWCSKTERCTGATTAFGNLESTGCSFNELYVRDSECFIISKTIPWMAVCAMLGVRLLFFFRSRLPVIRIRTFFN